MIVEPGVVIKIHLRQDHIHSVIVDLPHTIIGSAFSLDCGQLLDNKIPCLLWVSLIRHPSLGMIIGGIEWDVAEKIKQNIVIECTVASQLGGCRLGGLHRLVCQQLITCIDAGIGVIPFSPEMANLGVKLVLVEGNIEVAPANPDAIRSTPEVGRLILYIGITIPTPVEGAQAAVNGRKHAGCICLGKFIFLSGKRIVNGLTQVGTASEGEQQCACQ